MAYSTANTYALKRVILNFSNKFSHGLPKPERKFFANISYGMLVSQSCLLTDITDQPMTTRCSSNSTAWSRIMSSGSQSYIFFKWHIEEYFRCKKEVFQFENFRVRKLKAINALNFYITICMAFLAHISLKPETNALKVTVIQTAASIRQTVSFCYYRLAKGIRSILSYAKEGVRLWFRTKCPAYR